MISTDKVLLEVNESVSPIKVLSPSDEDFVYIIMPLKI